MGDEPLETYRNPFHANHLYLRLTEEEADALSPACFAELFEKHGLPLQVMVFSDAKRTISLLQRSGFELKRRCYELQVSSSDLLVHVSKGIPPLSFTKKDSSAYFACAELLYHYYQDTHAAVNPLTASLPEFMEALPDEVLYDDPSDRPTSAAFIEGNEIAYLCSHDRTGFPAFARSMLADLFDRYAQIAFEADDTDWAVTTVKDMFFIKIDRSFDTYVYLNQPCGYDKL